ncbi:T9SS type B sorting domain-containing protein [Flavobacterium sp. HJJ]|uniref:T9SS type B sorting domain-containing protein n=1 Tax=Flavobacterium sp. HJJ TaxID=2783792 RepID=UPI00188AD6C9|nr:T9SS type B sorting domain-containing protein [Flavobacterium sp. HJJ]MBF4471442.1 T9SS type B sorting domain-containing protein [Flavobacterium sp. HJJ]
MNFKYLITLLISVFLFPQLHAQLCTGSLGDPVVKLDFGSGTSIHGSALGTGITSYTYTTANFPSDGSYTVESTTNTPGTWWTTTDHTGGGYMMVVNASFSTTDYFYKNTVSGLCAGTTYEFAAWIMNLLRSQDNSPPNITFTIESADGTILGTYNTGNIGLSSSAVWKQYGFFFTTPSGVDTVVIRMRNNKAGAAPGNDIALDDITFRACGPTVTSEIVDQSVTNLDVCEGESKSITLSGSVSSSAYTTVGYQWQNSTDGGITWADILGANNAAYTFVSGAVGTYKYRLATADSSNISSTNCRVFSNEITINVKSGPISPTVETIQPNCDVPSGTITVTAPAGLLYSVDGVNYQSSMTFSGLAGGDYKVTAKSSSCVSSPVAAHINLKAVSSAVPAIDIIQPVICNNPFGTITVTSLDAEYSFDDGLTWQTSNVKTGFLPGEYLVKTRNSSLCEKTAITATILVPPGYPPTPTVSVTQPDCSTSTGTIIVSDNAASYSFDGGQSWTASPSKTGLVPNIYPVLIKNTIGCISLVANEVEIKAFVNTEPLPTAATQTFCVQQNAAIGDIAISGTNVKWYDAVTNGNLLAGTTILQSKTYYASQTITTCESLRLPVVVNIQNTPVPAGDSVQNFCTTQKPSIADLAVIGSSIIWYDQAAGGTVLPVTTNLVNGVTYYASQTVNGCESISRLAVSASIVVPSLAVNDTADFICDSSGDGSEQVDLTVYNSKIASCSSCTFTYFTSLPGAENKTAADQITASADYNLASGTSIVYVRIDSNDKCYQIGRLTLTLVNEPVISIPDSIPVCENYDVTINAGTGFDSYLWSTLETTPSIKISNAGAYSVTVTQNHGNTVCSAVKNFMVVLSNVAVVTTETQDWTDTENVIAVYVSSSSVGNYEYSLDGITYQDSNTFSGLLSGDYMVYVRDKNGCGITSQEVYILNYPKFFTPNGDGYNDSWAIRFSASEPKLMVKIFDRYGKFIKELNAASAWDGTYNGHELPSTDYWFVVTRANGKVYKGHFAMKR